ncbi:alginate lyase family protein [Marinagarivorans algicola]|uniref:hypothetical protein n=1 Tax=Marinagarivorans algicola TaxID=1513270 RepID=UPI003736E71F
MKSIDYTQCFSITGFVVFLWFAVGCDGVRSNAQPPITPARVKLQALALPAPQLLLADHIFVHPGALNNQADLNFVKQQIALGHDPWLRQLAQLKHMATPGVFHFTWIDASNKYTAEAAQYQAKKTYANALAWVYSGDEKFAQQGVALLASWQKLEGFSAGTDQDKLLAGWLGALIAPAAELLRLYGDWPLAEQAQLQQMLKRVFYPQLLPMSGWNGNVDLTQIDALLNIAVFNDDVTAFNAGLKRLHHRSAAYFYYTAEPTNDGAITALDGIAAIDGDFEKLDIFWHQPLTWQNGLTQETCRDNNHHAQYALASALHAAEVAWNQGVDVYAENAQRYMAAMELMAHQLLAQTMLGVCRIDKPTHNVFSTWEVGYNHYHHRQEYRLPNTRLLIKERVRPRGHSEWNIFYETLSFAK